jgi:hypothetical protein
MKIYFIHGVEALAPAHFTLPFKPGAFFRALDKAF